MPVYERPGVFASYDVSAVSYSGTAVNAVGVAAAAASGTEGTVYTIGSQAEAVAAFGAASNLTELIRILLLNGASVVKAIPASYTDAENESYTAAFAALALIEEVRFLVCDRAESAVHTALLESITGAEERCSYRIGIVEPGGTADQAVAAAAALNHRSITAVAPSAQLAGGDAAVIGSVAAAVAGVLASETDPALPIGGAQLSGIRALSRAFTESEINTLIQGGVTPVENAGGVSVVRGVTTKTSTGGAADMTWHELSTILIVNHVLPTVRDALRSRFLRTKNSAQTRGAIKARVVIELERLIEAEIISGYDGVAASQSPDDPTICLVQFGFSVTHGLNQIHLTAHITI